MPVSRQRKLGFRMYVEGPSLRQIKRDVMAQLKQFGFAGIVATTWAARDARDKTRTEIKTTFDRPTPLTQRSPYLDPASKAKPYARVWLIDGSLPGSFVNGTPPAKYLIANIKGGPREAKPAERSLRAQGIIGPNEFIIPAKVRRNRFGNVTLGTMQKILAGLGGFQDSHLNRPGSRARMSHDARLGVTSQARSSPYFVAKIGGLRAIWQRNKTSTPTPLFVIVKGPPMYRRRFDFVGIARDEFVEKWPGRLREAIAKYGKSKPGK
jgi:hypothetical protein